MVIPDEAQNYLAQYFPPGFLDSLNLRVAPPRLAKITTFARASGDNWIVVGSAPAPGVIVIHPRFFNLKTAAGLALIGHEACHAKQWRTIPGFLEKYQREEARRIRMGQGIEGNRYEAECYALERAIRRDLQRILARLSYPVGQMEPFIPQKRCVVRP